jgi:hypothetical protein
MDTRRASGSESNKEAKNQPGKEGENEPGKKKRRRSKANKASQLRRAIEWRAMRKLVNELVEDE